MSIFPLEWSQGARKIYMVEILHKRQKLHSMQSSTVPKIRIAVKKPSTKSCLALNFVQESLRGYMSIFPGVELILHLQKGQKIHFIYGSVLLKIRIADEKPSNKSCLALNFVQKIPRSGARGLERFIWSKYYIYSNCKIHSIQGSALLIQKEESREKVLCFFTLTLPHTNLYCFF